MERDADYVMELTRARSDFDSSKWDSHCGVVERKSIRALEDIYNNFRNDIPPRVAFVPEPPGDERVMRAVRTKGPNVAPLGRLPRCPSGTRS